MSEVSRRTYPAGSLLNGFWEDVRCAIGIDGLHYVPETGKHEGTDMELRGDSVAFNLYRGGRRAEVVFSHAKYMAEGGYGADVIADVGDKLRDVLKKMINAELAPRGEDRPIPVKRDQNRILRADDRVDAMAYAALDRTVRQEPTFADGLREGLFGKAST